MDLQFEKIPLGGLFGFKLGHLVMGRIRDIPRGLPRNQCWKGITNFLMMSLVCQTSQIQGHQLFKIIPELISYQNNVLSP